MRSSHSPLIPIDPVIVFLEKHELCSGAVTAICENKACSTLCVEGNTHRVLSLFEVLKILYA